jgi:hypothetical protein
MSMWLAPAMESSDRANDKRSHRGLLRPARRLFARVGSGLAALVLLLGSMAVVPSPVAAASLQVYSFNQSVYTKDQLPCGSTIAEVGCAVTALADVFNYYQVSVSSTSGIGMTPPILNAWLKAASGYSGCELSNWKTVPAGVWYAGSGSTGDTARVDAELEADHPVVAHVTGSGTDPTDGHYVVLTGKVAGPNYYIDDPMGGSQSSLSAMATR